MLRICLVLAVLGSTFLTAHGYVRTTTRVGEPVMWGEPCVPFHLHLDGSDDLGFGNVLSAFRNAMNTWMGNECSALSLDYQGVTDVDGAGYRTDGPNLNVLVFRERDADWIHAPSAFAVTTVTYCENLEGECRFLGEVRDADIEVNGAFFKFSAEISGRPPLVDLENTLTHEIGHVLGLAHSAVEGATMVADAAPGDISKRSLHADDIEGVCDIYPPGAAACEAYPVVGDYFAPDGGVGEPAAPVLPAGDAGCDAVGHVGWSIWLLLLVGLGRRRS